MSRRVFAIPDPVRLPLPSRELLEMAWYLNRIVSLSAAAEDRDLLYDNDDDENGTILSLGESASKDVFNWIPRPPSASPESDEEDHEDESTNCPSTLPSSPEKTRIIGKNTENALTQANAEGVLADEVTFP